MDRTDGWVVVCAHPQAHVPASISDREEEVALSVPSPQKFVPHLVPDEEQVVGVLASILQQVMWKGPATLHTRAGKGIGSDPARTQSPHSLPSPHSSLPLPPPISPLLSLPPLPPPSLSHLTLQSASWYCLSASTPQ